MIPLITGLPGGTELLIILVPIVVVGIIVAAAIKYLRKK